MYIFVSKESTPMSYTWAEANTILVMLDLDINGPLKGHGIEFEIIKKGFYGTDLALVGPKHLRDKL